MKPDILIFGVGGHALSCIDVIESEDRFNILGLVSKGNEASNTMLNYPVISNDQNLSELQEKTKYAIIGFGQIENPSYRAKMYDRLVNADFQLPTIISPRAYVSRHAFIGSGVIIMHGAIINAGAHIGSNCIINSRALVEHDCVIADGCHISTGANINGGVKVGSGTFIGSGAIIKHGVSISDYQVVQMGSIVFNSF